MSWKRILKTAKKFGTPVIVSDEMAEDPLVILPLELYEGLLGESGMASETRLEPKSVPPVPLKTQIQEPNRAETDFSPKSGNTKYFAKEKQKSVEEPTLSSLEISPEDLSSPIAGATGDSGFYFEPLEDAFGN